MQGRRRWRFRSLQVSALLHLLCNIAAEEYSHVEAVAATINLLLNGATDPADRNKPFGEDADSKKKKTNNKKDFGDANPAPLSDPMVTGLEIWNGPHPDDGMELEVRDEMPPGFPWPEFDEEPQLCVPGEIDPDMLNYYAKKLS